MPRMDAPATTSRFHPVLPLIAFAAVLLVATFFVGDTGVYNDDYFLNQRDPVTGAVGPLVMNRPWHLWRPMTRLVLPPLITTLWNHPWVLHAISACLHAAVVGLMYGLLRKFRVSATIAGPCALLFMVYPVHFEAVLWSSIICTLMSVVLVMSIWHVYAWWLERGRIVSGVSRLGILICLGVAAWCAAAFNEQPPGALAVLPLAVMVLELVEGSALAQRVRRSAMPVVAVAGALVWYLHGFFKHQISRPHPDKAKHIHAPLMERVLDLYHKIPGEMALRDFAKGAFGEGLRAIEAHPVTAISAGGVLAVVAVAWALAPRVNNEQSKPAGGAKPVWLIVLGLAWAGASWIPVVAAHSVTSSRLYYVPAIGCAIALAGVASIVAGFFGSRLNRTPGPLRPVARLGFSALVGGSLVVWIGVQANLRRRCDCDNAEIRPLVDSLASAIEPDTFLVPVRIQSRSVVTGSTRFDEYFQPCWYWEFAAGWRVQMAMHSRKVYTFQTGPGVGESLWLSPDDPLRFGLIRAKSTRPKPDNLVTLLPQTAAKDEKGRLVPWDRAVFFETTRAGETHLFTKLRLHIGGAAPVEIVPRQIAIAKPATPIPERVLDLYPIPPERSGPKAKSTATE